MGNLKEIIFKLFRKLDYSDRLNDKLIMDIKKMTKRTFGGTSRKRKRVSGFRVRMRSHTGRRVIKSRRQKGRERIAV